MLEDARRYAERQARSQGCPIRVLRPYGDDSTSVGDALRRWTLGINVEGRSFDDLTLLVMAAAEAGGGATAG